jgi:hypothetical protein
MNKPIRLSLVYEMHAYGSLSEEAGSLAKYQPGRCRKRSP